MKIYTKLGYKILILKIYFQEYSAELFILHYVHYYMMCV